jgi:hypothetical protein
MRAMVVEVGPELEQLVFEVCRRPKQHAIQYVGGAEKLVHFGGRM